MVLTSFSTCGAQAELVALLPKPDRVYKGWDPVQISRRLVNFVVASGSQNQEIEMCTSAGEPAERTMTHVNL